MTTLHKRALLLLTLLVLCLASWLLFGWQITLVLGIILSIGLPIPLSTLWRGLGQTSPQPQQEVPFYSQGYQEVPYYQSSAPQEAPLTEDVPMAQYPHQIQ